MADSYTRQSSFTDGDVIRAEHGNSEFNQLVRAFSETTGHNHDGTVQGGAPVPLIQDLSGTHNFSMTSTGFTSTVVLDEDDMVSNSAERLATQQSIKAYVDANSIADQAYADGLDAANRTWTSEQISLAVSGGVGGLVGTENTWTALQTFNVVPRATLDPVAPEDLTRKSWVDAEITSGIGALNLGNVTDGIYIQSSGQGFNITSTPSVSTIISRQGDMDIINGADGADINLRVDTDAGNRDTPLSVIAGATDGTSSVMLRYGDNDRLTTTTGGVQLLNNTKLSSTAGHPHPDRRLLSNSGSVTLEGSLGTGAVLTELWNWSVGGTYSLTESTYAIGDKIVFYKLYETCPTLTIVTDTGAFFYNGESQGTTMTMDINYKLKMEALKVDATNWLITAEVI